MPNLRLLKHLLSCLRIAFSIEQLAQECNKDCIILLDSLLLLEELDILGFQLRVFTLQDLILLDGLLQSLQLLLTLRRILHSHWLLLLLTHI